MLKVGTEKESAEVNPRARTRGTSSRQFGDSIFTSIEATFISNA